MKDINLNKEQIIELIKDNEQTALDNLGSYVDKENNVSKKDCITTLNILKNNIMVIINNYYKGYTVDAWNRDTENPAVIPQLISDLFLRYAAEDIISHITKKLWLSNINNKVHQIVDYAIHYLIDHAEEPKDTVITDSLKGISDYVEKADADIYNKSITDIYTVERLIWAAYEEIEDIRTNYSDVLTDYEKSFMREVVELIHDLKYRIGQLIHFENDDIEAAVNKIAHDKNPDLWAFIDEIHKEALKRFRKQNDI